MTSSQTPPSLASKLGGILSGDASSLADDSQGAAEQRKGLDIIKSQESQLSTGLDNVVRVPSTDGTGVSQAPAIEAIREVALMASEQPKAALQGQPLTAVSASPASDADSIRGPLMEAVRQARAALKDYQPVQDSTAADYAKKTRHLNIKIKALAASWRADHSVQIMKVVLGEYASKSSSFFAHRRALQFFVQQRLEKTLKDQDVLQKQWSKTPDDDGRQLLLEQMHKATQQLKQLHGQYVLVGEFERQACQTAYDAYMAQQPEKELGSEKVLALQTKQLVAVLNRRMPDWQQAFRAANENSKGRYRSHALLQSLTGIRPTEFDPKKNQPKSEAGIAPGVVATLEEDGKLRVRVPGGKVGTHSGQVERLFELDPQGLPAWFLQELTDAGRTKRFMVKPQALRDHYKRVSRRLFAGQTYGKAKKQLHVTPYCYRHALATELRWTEWDAVEIAAVLGHRKANTQSHYGFRKGGKRKSKAEAKPSIIAGSVVTTGPVSPQKSNWAAAQTEIRSSKTRRSTKP